MTPVIDPAVYTAFVLHYHCLERAEDQYAYIVTQKIEYGEHKQICFCKDTGQIEYSEYGVEGKPYKHNGPGTDIHFLDKFKKLIMVIVFNRNIKLFL